MINKYKKLTLIKLKEYSKDIQSSTISKDTYWIRKSKKVVIAMVCININGEIKYVPGINIEVSIATGSICAERNSISSAFSLYPNLKKKDVLAIAIGSFDLEDRSLKYIRPCCVCGAWLDKIWGSNWKNNVISVDKNPIIIIKKKDFIDEEHSVNFD